MATIYSSRHSKPLGGGRHAFGGGGLNLPITHLSGEGDIGGTFDDFEQIINSRGLATAGVNGIEDYGWVVTQVTGAAAGSGVAINDPAVSTHHTSSMVINAGTANDQGGNLQLITDGTVVNAQHFPHMWIPGNGNPTALDNTIITFACRVAIASSTTTYDGKAFIGFAQSPDTAIMVPTTGAIAVASSGPILGFHFNADAAVTPNISLIAKRSTAAAMADGTNFTNLISGVGSFETGLDSGIPSWFDVGFRMHVTDMSDDNSNGSVRAYFRRVPVAGGVFETDNVEAPGLRETQASDSGAVRVEEWREHDVVLQNQAPNDADELVPSIEVINGGALDGDFLVDWWSMGISRFSRRGV